MRELIRPTLFLIARLGLFLSVLAWGLGQTWSLEVDLGVRGVVADRGIACIGVFSYQPIKVAIAKMDNVRTAEGLRYWFFEPQEHTPMLKTAKISHVGFAECHLCWQPATFLLVVSIRHWLIVTVFALFNGVLRWVYRKRGKKLAADE